MSTFVFKWPADEKVKDVIVTGTFDNWSKSLPLVKRPDGSFELEVPIPKGEQKIEFKFILNGSEWVTSDRYWTIVDETGNLNNLIEIGANGEILKAEKNAVGESGKTEVGKTEVGKTVIPESGLSMGTNVEAKDVGTTVMPSEEGVQKTLGEPGIVVPENPREIEAFKEVRDVDAKELNAQIKKEEEDKEKKEKEEKTKYVKKVKKLVPKEGEESAAKPSGNTAPTSSNAPPASSSSKKEKKGLFSRFKKALS